MTYKKSKIAFIKYNGLGTGGTERFLQNLAAGIDKSKFEIDYFYTGNEDSNRLKFMKDNNINLIRVKCSGKVSDYGEWKDSDFWKKFNESKYDLIQSAIAGDTEWPFYLFKKPVVHSIHLDYGIDLSPNVCWSFFLSDWMRNKNIKMGGNKKLSSVVPIGCSLPRETHNLRDELGISKDSIIAGFHQRVDDNTYSDIPLNAFAKLQEKNRYFIIMGGSPKYTEQAKKLNIKNFIQIPHSANSNRISMFLNTLDIFAHGRRDGETFGYVFAEAQLHKLPCIGHWTPTSNAHKDTIGSGGFFVKNLEEYIEKLELLFTNNKIRKNLADSGFNQAKLKFIDTNYFKQIEYIYTDIIGKPSKYLAQARKNYFYQKIKKIKLIKKTKTDKYKIYNIFGIKIKIKRRKK